ncbi:hypothetical protein [Kaistella jeonii]|uniref:Uncharacterized protein n=1 Tax=Kaistella jeonii TaxID=266749 RepID=A0A0C1CUT3_9FLAO|nr:hypothetical protein [Kaistella jeonii]KIA88041.1 hypothetical protein OA86_12640 [Kaistella jeonii]SFC31123.1 hypothetical protein SAMN05421876_11322 [Kaistella jeonii]VEI95586.1 Uncharacterised protein [Kaistella jeonii]
MEIGKKFNQLTLEEYFLYIDNYKEYKDFNTLGLYRSILENENLNIDEKIKVREYSHKTFKKTFDFLQLKDPKTFVEVSTLGQEFTKGDEVKIWNDIRKNQQKILADKKIKHRNFGTYSKHNCPYEDCVWNGVMIRQGSKLSWGSMHFLSDKKNYHQKEKSEMRKSDRKSEKQIVNKELNI